MIQKAILFVAAVFRICAILCLLASLGRLTLYRHAHTPDSANREWTVGVWYMGLGILAILIASNLTS